MLISKEAIDRAIKISASMSVESIQSKTFAGLEIRLDEKDPYHCRRFRVSVDFKTRGLVLEELPC